MKRTRALLALALLVGLAVLASCGADRVRCEFSTSGDACADGTPCIPTEDGCVCGCVAGQRCAVVNAGGTDLHPICVTPCTDATQCLAGQMCDGTAVPCASCSAQFYVCR